VVACYPGGITLLDSSAVVQPQEVLRPLIVNGPSPALRTWKTWLTGLVLSVVPESNSVALSSIWPATQSKDGGCAALCDPFHHSSCCFGHPLKNSLVLCERQSPPANGSALFTAGGGHKEETDALVMHPVHPVHLVMFAFATQVPFRVPVEGGLAAGRAKVVGLALIF
jgi:hypothetical protein